MMLDVDSNCHSPRKKGDELLFWYDWTVLKPEDDAAGTVQGGTKTRDVPFRIRWALNSSGLVPCSGPED